MSTSTHYATSLSDEQWHVLQLMLPEPKWQPGGPGRPPLDLRRVVDGIFYVNNTGCQWRMMPHDFGSGMTIYGYFRRWRQQGVWHDVMDTLRIWERRDKGQKDDPSAGCADSQSIKVTTQPQEVGFDGNKKIKGCKRHVLVDTLGLLLAVVVTAANVDDRQGFVTLLERYLARGGRRLRKIWVDHGYEAQWLKAWAAGLKQTHKIDVEVVERQGTGFQVEPHRWKVERTFSWISNARRNCRDYEVLTCNSEAMIEISTIPMLLKRLIQ
jgi:putative transposase